MWRILSLFVLCNICVAQDWVRIHYEENEYCYQEVEFVRQGQGYFFGGASLRATIDNGFTWQEDQNWQSNRNVEHLVFRDSLQGIAVTGDYSYALTFDGGITWLERSTSNVPLGKPVYVDESTLVTTWLWTPNGFGTDLYVAFSLDSGLNWVVSYHVENLVTGDSFMNLTSGGEGSVYASSFFYGLVRSFDLGATWTPVDVQPTNRVVCLACPSPGVVLVTNDHSLVPSDSSYIMRSEDYGVTWATVWSDSLMHESFDHATFVDSLYGWAAGDNGVILNTTDGGRTWRRDSILVPQYTYVHSVDFVSRSEGWLLLSYFDWNPRWCARALYAYRDAQNDVPPSFVAVPQVFSLTTYPNPFNSTVRIDYELPRASDIQVNIYNTLGEEVATLFDGRSNAGTHSLSWSPNTASGVYFVKLVSGDFVTSRKILYLR